MRPASLLGGLAVASLVALAGAARAEPYDAVIEAETDARCGPGDGAMFYSTNHLHRGDRVRVVKDEDGVWLAIVPPSSSFSWIRKDQVKDLDNKQPRALMVDAATADVRIGSAVTKEPPLVIGKRAPRGTILTPLPNGDPKTDNEGTWLPIYPPDGELRYIRAEAIRKPAAAPTAASVVAVPPGDAPAAPGQDAEGLYRKAIEAEKWNPQEAVALYNQGANNDANPDRRIQALNRANWLRDNLRNPTQTIVPGPTPGADLRTASAPAESKVYPLNTDPAVRLSAPQGVGAPGLAATTTSAATPTGYPAPAATAPGGAREYSTKPGWLRNAGRVREGRKTYVMTDDRTGLPFYYVTAEPGVNLDAYVNRRVECYGEAIYDGELRHNYMRVSRVEVREGQ